jgi:hypothetical protein
VAPTLSAPTTLAAVAAASAPVAGVAVADANATVAGETLTVTLSDTLGALTATTAAGGAVTGSGTAKLVLTGTLAQVNGDLATLSYVSAKAGSDSIAIGATTSTGETASPLAIAVTAAPAPKATAGVAGFVQAMAAMTTRGDVALVSVPVHAVAPVLTLSNPRP